MERRPARRHPRKLLDISRITALGWAPRIGLREGVGEVYAWYADRLGSGDVRQ